MAVVSGGGEAVAACNGFGHRFRHHVSDHFDPPAARQANRRRGVAAFLLWNGEGQLIRGCNLWVALGLLV